MSYRDTILAVLLAFILAGAIVFVANAALDYLPETAETQLTPAVSPPEQLTPQVIFVYSCGVPQGLIITTDPLTFRDVSDPLTPDIEALLDAAEAAGRGYKFNGYLKPICDETSDGPF